MLFSTIARVRIKSKPVLRLATWLKQMGYIKKVKFVSLIVGHTKNALQTEYIYHAHIV